MFRTTLENLSSGRNFRPASHVSACLVELVQLACTACQHVYEPTWPMSSRAPRRGPRGGLDYGLDLDRWERRARAVGAVRPLADGNC